MNPAFRTRDGSFSPTAVQLAALDAGIGQVEVSPTEAAAWARDNKVELIRGEGATAQLGRINVMRREFHLPVFVLRAERQPLAPARPKPALVAAKPEPPPSLPIAKDKPMPATRHAVDAGAMPIADSQDALLNLVTGFDGLVSGLVTPEIAGWLLDLNTANRPMQGALVRRFAALLKADKWVLTGEAIIVSREGLLNDGQHRLKAIVEADIPALLDVRFGIERAAFAQTNTGARRTAGQALAISGSAFASAQAAVARLLRHYDAREMAKASLQVEPAEVISIVEQNPQILEVVKRQRGCRFAPARIAPIGLVLAVAARTAPNERVAAFLEIVNSGLAEETNAARVLHVRLRDAAIARERISQIDAAILAARAWNAWHQGRPLQLLRVDESNRTSAGFPEILA